MSSSSSWAGRRSLITRRADWLPGGRHARRWGSSWVTCCRLMSLSIRASSCGCSHRDERTWPLRVRSVLETVIAAPPALVFALVHDPERWPRLLPHYAGARVVNVAADDVRT